MNQNEMVLFLLKRRSLTQRQATAEGIGRLGARIYDLRSQGHAIVTTMIKVKSRWGSAYIARYSL